MKLYYENAYVKEFDAVVTGCAQIADGYAVTLDKTAFYPEGGGQPYDTGFIGKTRVNAVYERGGEILHYTSIPIETGTTLHCEIDWERRFLLMQGHTGEHILSGIIKKQFGLTNVGFHMGSEFITIDVNGELNREQLDSAEKEANRAIYENISVLAEFKSAAELERIDYRSKGKIDGDVRIVHIEGYDTCACCGIHLNSTGEAGVIKIINSQKYKAGTRIFLLCGESALSDYTAKNNSVYSISRILSAKPNEVSEAVTQLVEETASLKHRLSIFKGRVISSVAEKVPENSGLVCLFEPSLTPDELRRLCMLICERAELAAVFSGEQNAYKYALGSKTLDTRKISAALNANLNGRGGGKAELVQGSLHGNEEQIEATINKEYKLIFA